MTTTGPSESFQLPLEAAELYESAFVPGFFAQWAPLLCDAAGVGPGHEVLDVACGTGIVARTAAQRVGPGGRVVGVDLNEAMLTVARRVAPQLEWRQGDVARLPSPDGAFDRVFALEIMEHVPHPLRLLEQARRLLAPDGRLVISVPNPYYWVEWIREARGQPDPEGHVYAWSDANLRGLLAMAGFAVEERTGTYLEVPLALRRPFRRGRVAHLTRIPALLARSR